MSHDSQPDTLDHIGKVQSRLRQITGNLEQRGRVHDASKLISPEKEGFDALGENVPEYGTEAYREHMRAHKPTIQGHHAANDHHPEYFENRLEGMSLLSLTEMFADWKGANERNPEADFKKPLEYNRERFGISDQLYSILLNTAEELGW